MYFLCIVSGETRWIFKTGDAVKSSPTVDPVTGVVIVGSHDGTVYGLNPEVRKHYLISNACHRNKSQTAFVVNHQISCSLTVQVILDVIVTGYIGL